MDAEPTTPDRDGIPAERLRAALIAGEGSPSKAAKILGVSRVTVHKWMRRHSITVDKVVRR